MNKSQIKRIVGIVFLMLMGLSQAFGQTDADSHVKGILNYISKAMQFNMYAPHEKVYLHFDNTGYFKGETIRFMAYLTRTDNGKPSDISKVLYVELVNPSGDVIEKRTLKVENGMAEGDILLDSIMGASGFFEVRAFTRYMTNWGTDAIFSRVFPIFDRPKTEGDYSHMTIDKISFRHRLPDERVASGDLATGASTNKAEDSQTVGRGSGQISVGLFPEGGDLVKGLKSRVAINVSDNEGRHLKTEGKLLDDAKQVIGSVSTDESGRGIFEIVPDGKIKYVSLTAANGKQREVQLPEAKAEGISLTLDTQDEDIVTASMSASIGMQGRMLGYVIIHGGEIVECDTMTAKANMVKRFSRYSLPEGVNQLTVFDSDGHIQSERLFFICPFANEGDSIIVSTNTSQLTPCGKVSLDINAQPNSSISFSAMDAATMTGGKVGNAKTWMLLASDVRGYIENPDYYFESDDKEHRKAADLLMMVQGWRRYDWSVMSGQRVLDKVEPAEDGLYLYGQLKHRSKKKDVAGVDLRAYLFNRSGESLKGEAKTDSLGRYSFAITDIFNDWALQIKSEKDGEAENYIVTIDRNFSPDKRVLSPYETETIPVPEAKFFKENNSDAEDEEWVSITKKVHVLPTVKVRTRRILGELRVTWFDEDEAQRLAAVYYDCDPYADEINDKGELMPSFDEWLISKNSLIDGNPDPGDGVGDVVKVRIGESQSSDDEESGGSNGSDHFLTLYNDGLSYNNRPIIWIVNNTFCTITHLPYSFNTKLHVADCNNLTDVIRKPEFLNEAKSVFFTENTSTLIRYINSDNIYGMNPVIAFVYTHPLFYFKEKGLRKSHFYGYNKPTKFEMEDYSIVPPMEDFRRTIFWDANVKTDSKGHAKVEFYNNSSATQLFISAEGITPEGKFLINE